MKSATANFPALRCHMGDWTFYVTAMPFNELATRVQRSTEIYEVRGLEDMVQRELTNRVGNIVEYLLQQKERFFNAVILGMHEGEPRWYPLDIKQSPVLGRPEITTDLANAPGIIGLTGNEKMFAIDGQHRIAAIKEALEQNPDLGAEVMAVIFVAHQTTRSGRERTRRLFSTLNREAKPVSKGEIVALDEDDAFAITARRLVREYNGLSPGFRLDGARNSLIHFGKTSEIQKSNRSSITSILALYDMIKILELPRTREKRGLRLTLTKIRPSDQVLDRIYRQHVLFWEALRKHVSELGRVAGSDPRRELASEYRRPDGGHILFRPAGQKAFAGAVRILLDRGLNLDGAVKALSSVVLELNQRPWLDVLWDSRRRRMIVRNQTLAENLILYMANHQPHPTDYDLLSSYRKAVGDQSATLDDLV